ncbi:MAG: TetR/AcrR family transcriptional regulator [Actinomycetota bacterium]
MNVKRKPRQSQKAAATRSRIIAAAGSLFGDRGYSATTIEAIAQAADVSVETVYSRFGNKRARLSAYLDVSVAGDDRPTPILERPDVRSVASLTDQAQQVFALAHVTRAVLERSAPVQRVLRAAVESDQTLEDLAISDDQYRRTVHRGFVAMLKKNGPLLNDMSLVEARDRYSALANPDTYAFLTRRRGWTADHYEAWLCDALIQTLLPASASQATSAGKKKSRPHRRQ